MINKIYIFILLLSTVSGFTQQTQLSVADKKYNNLKYIDAIKIYEKVVQKGYKSHELYEKIANSYYFNSDFTKAENYYEKLVQLTDSVSPEIYYRYAQTLKTTGNYNKSTEYLKKYYELTNNENGVEKLQDSNYLVEILNKQSEFTIDTISINSPYYDFTPAFFKNNLVFASSRVEKNSATKIHDWTNQTFTDLFIVDYDDDGNFGTTENFSLEINSKFNESSPVFTKDGKKMFFTRNNYMEGKKGKDKNRTTLIKIYSAELINNVWTNIKELPFNCDSFSVAHPALDAENKYLYFTSDIPGTLGGADIFRVKIESKNKFGKPENLGNTINTSGRESFPFLDADNTLYFASDGHPGQGGLDVFKSEIENKTFGVPSNIGKPINSPFDDFALILNTDKKGFFTSNRKGGKGFDDIYKITGCIAQIEGVITDLKTNEVLKGVNVTLFNEEGEIIEEVTTDENGNYRFSKLACNKNYTLKTTLKDFETTDKIIQLGTDLENQQNISLERNVFQFEKGTDLAKVFNISKIYFDLDKWNIRPDAARDIQKVIEVMLEYPDMKVAINSHTDSRQTHAYNELLSDRRAKSTLEFMVASGIERNRLTAKGFGENQLVNECADGVYCTEEAHQLNRRSEFIVIE